MSLSAETLRALQELMAQNKELLAQVQATDDAAQVATLIAEAAAKSGIEALESDIAQHFEEASKTASNQALSDQQLESVAGGLNEDGHMALISVFTFGIGCAWVSIGQASGSGAFFDKKFC